MGNNSRVDLYLTIAALAYVAYVESTGDREMKRARQWAAYYLKTARRAIRKEIEPGWMSELRDFVPSVKGVRL